MNLPEEVTKIVAGYLPTETKKELAITNWEFYFILWEDVGQYTAYSLEDEDYDIGEQDDDFVPVAWFAREE